MEAKRFLVLTLVAAGLAAAVPAFAVESHDHPAAAPHQLSLDHGRKWQTDEPLRRAMDDIRAALAQQRTPIQGTKLTPAEAKALGARIERDVGDIVAECKLPPAADANLHIVVAELVAAADALQGRGGTTTRAAGMRKAVHALDQYGRYFDHPGWKALPNP